MFHSLSWQLSSMDLVQDNCNPLDLLSWHQGAFQAPVSWDKLLVTLSTPGCHFHHSHISHTTSWLGVKIGVGKVREREREREICSKWQWATCDGIQYRGQRNRESRKPQKKNLFTHTPGHKTAETWDNEREGNRMTTVNRKANAQPLARLS